MPVFECVKCSPTNVPDEWTIEEKTKIAVLVRSLGPISAIQRFRPVTMDLGNAKSLSFHITKEKGFCHKCVTSLTEYEGKCPECKCLNLDW